MVDRSFQVCLKSPPDTLHDPLHKSCGTFELRVDPHGPQYGVSEDCALILWVDDILQKPLGAETPGITIARDPRGIGSTRIPKVTSSNFST